ncbi:MAG: sporulation integral membrane protein YtvI [Ruminococcaceae bacterium]|nr:sporulation integral membrane protein YtvI [Oscillospiraceae bacterium]
MDKTEKRRKFIINVIYFALISGFIILFLRYAIKPITPFVVAFFVALVLQPPIRWISKRLKIKKSIVALVLSVLFYLILVLIVVLLGVRLVTAISDFLLGLPDLYNKSIMPVLNDLFVKFEKWMETLDPTISETINLSMPELLKSLGRSFTGFSVSAVGKLSGSLTQIPKLLVSVIFSILSTVFISAEMTEIKNFISAQFSEETRKMARNIRVQLSKTILQYARSYSVILVITFVELSIGLLIIGIKDAILIAALIAVFDILPVVGSAVILVPWGLISLAQGNLRIGIGLLIMTAVITVIRNIIEPKIVGEHVGLPPLVTIMSMVIGGYLFGGIGVLALPVSVAIISALNEAGTISLFKYPEHQESDSEAEKTDVEAETPSVGNDEEKE